MSRRRTARRHAELSHRRRRLHRHLRPGPPAATSTSSAAAAGSSTGSSSASASTRRRRRSSRWRSASSWCGRSIAPFPTSRSQPFTGLAVRFVREVGARIMLRGLRTTSDMENEFTMSLMNLNLDPEIETVFLMAKEAYSHVSSTLLRQIATFGGDLDKFLPAGRQDGPGSSAVRERSGDSDHRRNRHARATPARCPTRDAFDDFIRAQAPGAARQRRAARRPRRPGRQRRDAAARRRCSPRWGRFPRSRARWSRKSLGVLKRDGYRIEKLIFQTRPDVWVTANAYVPEPVQGQGAGGAGGPRPLGRGAARPGGAGALPGAGEARLLRAGGGRLRRRRALHRRPARRLPRRPATAARSGRPGRRCWACRSTTTAGPSITC